jgi:hypothetical protein
MMNATHVKIKMKTVAGKRKLRAIVRPITVASQLKLA